MKKIVLALLLCFAVLLGLSETPTHAAASSAKVKEVLKDTLLLDDGTIWLKTSSVSSGYIKYQADVVTMTNASSDFIGGSGQGLTANGELVYWNQKTAPTVDKTQSNIVQIDGFYYLKSDGTVWNTDGQQDKDIKDAVIISGLAHINKKGEIRASSNSDVYGVVDDPNAIVALKKYSQYSDDILAYLDNKGKVVVYDGYDFDSSSDKLPRYSVVVTEDAASIDFHYSGALIVTKKDGTAWITDPNQPKADRYKLTNQIPGIKDAAQVTNYSGTLISNVNDRVPEWLVKQKDGAWKIYKNNTAYPIEAPTVSDLSLTASNSKPVVGNTISFKTVQSYNNGYKETITDATLTFDKPYLVKAQTNGSYKAAAVGETKVSVSVGGTTKNVTLSISANSTLTGAISKDNTTYLPMVSVFKALGGTVKVTDGKTFDITLGDTKLQLKTGQKKATLNGKEITLNQPVQVLNGSNVFPAALLTKASIAKLEWDNKYKKMKISVGKATLIVNSAETAGIEKKEKQGSLAQYINKTYWVNRYDNWQRFMKLTVTDIVPVSDDYFNVVFKNSNGKSYSINNLYKDIISSTLQDEDQFLSYDPYKKYNWSSSTWELIKAEKIKLGMNKAQVKLSWGSPNSISTASSSSITVEVWRYGKQYVSFTNGIVDAIYSL